MLDDEQIALLVYNHVVQLTLIDYLPDEAFALAHRVAATAFDMDLTRAGLEAARRAAETVSESAPQGTPVQAKPSVPKG